MPRIRAAGAEEEAPPRVTLERAPGLHSLAQGGLQPGRQIAEQQLVRVEAPAEAAAGALVTAALVAVADARRAVR